LSSGGRGYALEPENQVAVDEIGGICGENQCIILFLKAVRIPIGRFVRK
jgi:hypothetical protein